MYETEKLPHGGRIGNEPHPQGHCQAIHPTEGARCEKLAAVPHTAHVVKGYWCGSDDLRWTTH